MTTKYLLAQQYDLQNYPSRYFNGISLELNTLGNHFADLKFVDPSWLDFFETYVLPSTELKIRYNKSVNAIDYSSNEIAITTMGAQTYTTNKVIVAMSVRILQNGKISFTPSLSFESF